MPMTADLVLVLGLGALGVLAVALIPLGFVVARRRRGAFVEMARISGLLLRPGAPPWVGLVASGTVLGREIEVGRARIEATGETSYIRFRAQVRAPFPRGLYVHSQPFRHNTADPRAASVPYDGRYDDPSTTSLLGDVSEIPLGDPELDRAFVIQGEEPAAVRAFLTQPELRARLLAAAANRAHVRLRGAAIELDVDETTLGSVDAYSKHLGALVGAAEVLDRGHLLPWA